MDDMEDLDGLEDLDLEDDDLGLEEDEGMEGEDDLEAFDSALDTAAQIFHRRMESEGMGGEDPVAGPPMKLAPGAPRPKFSLKK